MKGKYFQENREQLYETNYGDESDLIEKSREIKQVMEVFGKLQLTLVIIKIAKNPQKFLKAQKNSIKKISPKYEVGKACNGIIRMGEVQKIIDEIKIYNEKQSSEISIKTFIEKIGYYYIWQNESKENVLNNLLMQIIKNKVEIIEQINCNKEYFQKIRSALDLKINITGNKTSQGCVYEISSSKSERDFYCYNETTIKTSPKEFGKMKIFYQYFVEPLEQVCSGKEMWIPKRILQIFVDCINTCDIEILPELVENLDVFDFRKAVNMGIDKYVVIIKTLEYLLENQDSFELLKNKLIELNAQWLFVYNEKIYSYDNIFLDVIDYKSMDNGNSILDFIVNPTSDMVNRIIDDNYRKVLNYDNKHMYINKMNHKVRNFLSELELLKSSSTTSIAEQVAAEDTSATFYNLLEDSSPEIYILNSKNDISKQICGLFDEIDIVNIFMASGYVFQSGLNLLSQIFNIAEVKKIKIDLLAGSLQKYNSCVLSQSILLGMDKVTAKSLNRMLKSMRLNLYTIEERFYHGKIYYFEGKEKSAVIIGSSNISHSAYQSNYELNVAFVLENSDKFWSDIKSWINQTKVLCTQISALDESVFADKEINMDMINTVDLVDDIQRKIDSLEDDELKYRLNLWMSYKPTLTLEKLGIDALPEYIAFVFEEYGMIVLESFESGNSYFCLKYSNDYQYKIKQISGMSKTEIFNISKMKKRGYHISNKILLEKTVRGYFNFK